VNNIRLNWKGEEVKKKISSLINSEMKDMCEDIVSASKDKSPKDTGHNASSITWDEKEGKFRVYTQSGYGAYLELGTTKMDKRPYIYPSYQEAAKHFLSNLKGIL
jgi:hypothetical protein